MTHEEQGLIRQIDITNINIGIAKADLDSAVEKYIEAVKEQTAIRIQLELKLADFNY